MVAQGHDGGAGGASYHFRLLGLYGKRAASVHEGAGRRAGQVTFGGQPSAAASGQKPARGPKPALGPFGNFTFRAAESP